MENNTLNPAMLKLARHTRGYTQKQLSSLLGMTPFRYSRLEAGVGQSTDKELTACCDTLNYPRHFFLRNIAVQGPGADGTFHRKRQAMPKLKLDQAYGLAEVRRIEIQQLLEWEQADCSLPLYPVDLYDEDPAKIARTTRAVMGLPPGPVANMTKVIEQAGGVVVMHDFGTRQIDGFSHRLNPSIPPLFHMNSELPPDRWRWTLAHELGHVVMDHDPAAGRQQIEAQANQFAGEFLAPGNEIMPMLIGLNINKLAGLKLEWKISMQAIIERSFDLGAITSSQRRNMHVHLSKAGYKSREPASIDPLPEPPERLFNLAKMHMTTLRYSREEMLDWLAITEKDFQQYYSDPLDAAGQEAIAEEWRVP